MTTEASVCYRALISDFDGTLVPFDETDIDSVQATKVFSERWLALPVDRRPLFIVNSGRMVQDLQAAVLATTLPSPAYYIGGVGTQICDAEGVPVPGYAESLGQGFDVSLIETIMRSLPAVEPQPQQFQSAYKSSWYWYGASESELEALRRSLKDRHQDVTVVYSSSRDLDIVPVRADKGQAIQWLAWYLGWADTRVIVSGDSGNDASMFGLPGVTGIIVENGHQDLRQAAAVSGNHFIEPRGTAAAGICNGLEALGVFE